MRVSIKLVLMFLLVSLGDGWGSLTPAQAASGEDSTARAYPAGPPAAPFPKGLEWLNVPAPLTLEDLRGKVVLLDFWTYGCINCMHIIPDLKRLEAKYGNALVVIGVHSAKFENESDTAQIRKVVMRYDLEHPVVNDKDLTIWREYGAHAWPTLVLIDPAGQVVGAHAGEGIFEPFDRAIAEVIRVFDGKGTLNRTPLKHALEKHTLADSVLRFPGKVLADTTHNRLFIADSQHHRILMTDLTGKVLETIGGGEGFADGDFGEARFRDPQGMTLVDADTLYVADRLNHALRKIDLKTHRVTTAAGTGEQGYITGTHAPAKARLNSPWDVLHHDGKVYIAMAGQHQIWAYDLKQGALTLHAGSGREILRDGPLLEAGLNQPSGLTTDGKSLYIADAEASAIRAVSLDPQGEVETIVGTGLFDFGDRDGAGREVRLQHPLGIAWHEDLLYVADTYNDKIKLIDPKTRESQTLIDQDAGLDEPGGVDIAGDRLLIADTNNHTVRAVDLKSLKIEPLALTGVADDTQPAVP